MPLLNSFVASPSSRPTGGIHFVKAFDRKHFKPHVGRTLAAAFPPEKTFIVELVVADS